MSKILISTKAVVACSVAVATVAASAVAITVINKDNDSSTSEGTSITEQVNDAVTDVKKRDVIVNEENVEEVAEQIINQTHVAPGNYNVKMNTTWHFTDGSSPSYDSYVENPETNTNDVYFDIVRSDTNEMIYSSPVISLGAKIENITLDTVLEAGTYDCVLTYHLVDSEQRPISKLNVGLDIIVEG